MRIELINNSSTSNSISLLGTNLTSLISQSETSISSLRALKNFSHSMNGGVGLLQSAVDSIDARIKQEETRKGNLVDAKKKIDSFTELVGTTDRSVSNLVNQNQEMFYGVNEWSRPSVLSSQLGAWFASAKSWLSGVAKDSLDAFDHTWSVYNETDYSSLSDEEMKCLCDRYLEMLDGELSQDDKTRLQSLLNYLSKTEVNSSMSDLDKRKIESFNSIYEKMHPDEAEKMKELFSNAPAEYKDDIKNIKFIAYKSTGECHDLFFEYADKIKIADYSNGGKYSPNDMSIYIKIESMRNNNYGTFFHESGHSIDAFRAIEATGTDINQFRELLANASSEKEIDILYEKIGIVEDKDLYYSSSTLANSNFHGIVYKEVEGIVSNLVNNYSNNEKNLSDDQKALIKDVLMGRKFESEIKNSDTDFAYRKVLEDITGAWKGKYSRQYQDGREVGILEVPNARMLSEVMNGMTNNSLMVNGEYAGNVNNFMGDYFGKAHITAGHPINWQNPSTGDAPIDYYYNSDGSYTGIAESEYMADYMRINMTGSEAEKDYVTRYLHDSWNAMTDDLKKHNTMS